MTRVQPDDPIVLKIQLTSNDVGRLVREMQFHDSKSVWITLSVGLLVGVVSLFDGLRSVGIVILLAMPVPALLLASTSIQGKRVLKTNPTVGEKKVWTFAADGIEVTGASQTTKYDWATFGSMYQRSQCIYLKANNSSLRVLVPLRVFESPEDADRFRDFVRRHLSA